MIYAGQEFGEAGMDKEGFSGIDGRTTIFDYWCVESLRRGYYDRRKLTDDAKRLERQYQQILNIARKEEAVVEGKSFDLMYANQHLFNDLYAFLRGNSMLVAVNFCEYEREADIVIPAHAFDYMGIGEGTVEAVDLLNGDKVILNLYKDNVVKVSIPAHGGVVLKF